jgi:hypothetical protein
MKCEEQMEELKEALQSSAGGNDGVIDNRNSQNIETVAGKASLIKWFPRKLFELPSLPESMSHDEAGKIFSESWEKIVGN